MCDNCGAKAYLTLGLIPFEVQMHHGGLAFCHIPHYILLTKQYGLFNRCTLKAVSNLMRSSSSLFLPRTLLPVNMLMQERLSRPALCQTLWYLLHKTSFLCLVCSGGCVHSLETTLLFFSPLQHAPIYKVSHITHVQYSGSRFKHQNK